jgi:hypothetical protein
LELSSSGYFNNIIIITINLKMKAFINTNKRTSLEKLLNRIYVDDDYNNEVRPFNQGDQTKVETELKLLQIDLDEKYQQLV